MLAVTTSRGASVLRSPRISSALIPKLAAFTANAHPTPAVEASSPASGASSTWLSTAADQMPEFAATSSSLSTKVGSSDPAAGLKNTDPADSPNATAYTTLISECHNARMAASTSRARSAVTITRTRGSRSTSGPATGASSSTGAISASTAPDTPRPEPVKCSTSSASVVNWATSPHCDTVRAAHSRRYPGLVMTARRPARLLEPTTTSSCPAGIVCCPREVLSV